MSADEEQAIIGVQPILDASKKTAAYELLFRSSSNNFANVVDDTQATAAVLSNMLVEFDLDRLVGGKPAYLNFGYEMLTSEVADLLPQDRVVLEILETTPVDENLVQAVSVLVKRGYTIALDDFEHEAKWEPLLDLASIVKLDVMALGLAGVEAQLSKISKHSITLLAEKVETHEEFIALKAMGFDLFQGFFFYQTRDRESQATSYISCESVDAAV